MFLRGTGGNSAGLGIAQGDAIRNITGSVFLGMGVADNAWGVFTRSNFTSANAAGNWVSGVARTFDFNASHVVPTAPENRPVNMAVRYLIRAAM